MSTLVHGQLFLALADDALVGLLGRPQVVKGDLFEAVLPPVGLEKVGKDHGVRHRRP